MWYEIDFYKFKKYLSLHGMFLIRGVHDPLDMICNICMSTYMCICVGI